MMFLLVDTDPCVDDCETGFEVVEVEVEVTITVGFMVLLFWVLLDWLLTGALLVNFTLFDDIGIAVE